MVATVNYGSTELLVRHLPDLRDIAAQTIVVDNYFSHEERLNAQRACATHGWKLIESNKNLGFGAAANLAVDEAFAAGASLVLLLNPDARIDSSALERLTARAESMEIVSPRILQSDGTVWFDGAALNRVTGIARHSHRLNKTTTPDWLTGACLLIPREAWDRLGGFDASFFLYWEDVDLSVRARAMGIRLRIDQEVVAYHDAGGTQEGDGKSPTYVRYIFRNRRLVGRRFGAPVRLLWLLSTPYYAALMARVIGVRKFLGDEGAAHRRALWLGLTERLPRPART
ncbi:MULTISPECIES: glycosyltransferase family 2 protein [unclassified Microbacterium]|uniref:glycosyltransferase family 2 protein n=1 Tax=unclassified Microbacterium TaxID=2609290 RepID=UPI003C2BCB8F